MDDRRDDMESVNVVKWTGRWMFNVSWEDFVAFMRRFGMTHMSGIQGQWDSMRENPMFWWLNLDEDIQRAVVQAAVEKYSK